MFWLAASPSFTAMAFWCGGRLFSAPDSVQREKVGKRLFFHFVLVRLSLQWCFGVAEAVFSTRVSTTGKGWEKVKKYF